nr:SGNH/GDSL hydrolase family protein [Allomuricauda sp.]
MKRRHFLGTMVLGYGSLLIPNVLSAKKAKSLPNILLLGDSISLGYTEYVKEKLKGKANIIRPLNKGGGYINCQGTTNGLRHVEEWLGLAPKWDMIYFNFGLHDLKHVDPETGKNSKKQEDPQQADLKTYKKNLTAIVEKLKSTNAKLIFATTTSYPDRPGGPLRRADQPKKYNKVALQVMKKFDVQIDDLNALTLPRLAELQLPNNVHFTKKGSEVLGKHVAKSMLESL